MLRGWLKFGPFHDVPGCCERIAQDERGRPNTSLGHEVRSVKRIDALQWPHSCIVAL